jgi:hypothetical protein
MTTILSTGARNAAAGAIALLPDAGAAAGYIEIRTGSQPAGPGSAATGTLLATITLDDPSFGSPATGVCTLAGLPITATGVGDGTAGYARFYDSNDLAIIDCSVTAEGGGGQIELNTTTISTGVDFELTAGTITMPAS